jgi:hypothetical protein
MSHTNGCSLTNAETVTVTIRNASPNSISNIPIRMVVDGGTPVIEIFAGPLAADGSTQYTFTAKANLSALGAHTILLNVQYGTDNFKDNDTLIMNIFNAPLITTFLTLKILKRIMVIGVALELIIHGNMEFLRLIK